MGTATAWKNRITGTGEEDPEQLLANPKNWRIHPKHQQDALDAVLNEIGWVQRIIVNERTGHVIDGHLRVSLALRREEKTVPVVYVDLLENEEALILATIDPLSALAATDKEQLEELLREVETGSAELQKMLAELAVDNGLTYGATGEEVDAEPQIDRAAELQEQWKVQRGQLWQLGGHRLMCGDSTDKADVAQLMEDEKAAAIITDPPYNVDKAIWDSDVLPLLRGAASLWSTYLQRDGICFWFCATRYIPQVIEATAAIPYRWMFIWYPSNNMAHGDLGFQKFTAALVLGFEKVWRKDMQDLREVPIVVTNENVGHPTPKPVPLISYLVEKATENSELIVDPFVGSGTTIIAAEQLNRRCFAMEIEPKYVAVCLQRFVDATGKEVKCLAAAAAAS